MVRATGTFPALEVGGMLSRGDSAILESGAADFARPAADGIRRIVVPLDGSRTAEHALPYAIAIARRSGASIRLVHVFSLLESFDSWEQTYHRGVADHYRRQKHRYLDAVVDRVRSQLDGPVTSAVIGSPDVPGTLGSMSDAGTLMIMAARRRSFLSKFFMGSVSDDLIRKLEGPLLLVRGSSAQPDWSSDPLPRHILIPLDGTACAERAVVSAAQLGALGNARYSLVHLRDAGRMVSRAETVAAREYLEDVARRARVGSPGVAAEVLVSERNIATDLLEFAEKEGADWIALTAHARPAWARLLRRSVANSVVRRAPMPLLIVRHTFERDEQCAPELVESLGS